MVNTIAQLTADPAAYYLFGNKCTNFVRAALQQAGVAVSATKLPRPKPFFEALVEKP